MTLLSFLWHIGFVLKGSTVQLHVQIFQYIVFRYFFFIF